MWSKLLMAFCLGTMLAMMACSSTATPTVTTGVQPARASTPTRTLLSPVAPTSTTKPSPTSTPLPRLQSGEQPVWTNTGEETNTLLVTLQPAQGQLEQGESTVITASANNRSGSPLDVGLIIQLGAGLMVSSSTGCSGDPCSGRFTASDGQQASMNVITTLETGAVRNRYELILNYEYTDLGTRKRKTGRINGKLTSGLTAPTPTPYPTYTPVPTYTPRPTPTHTPYPTYTPYPTPETGPTYTPYPTYTPWPTPTFTPMPTYTPYPTYTPAPTHTPWPTPTPVPTATPIPTATPVPTATPTPTLTPTLQPTLTPRPTATPRPTYATGTFGLGSTKDEVLAAQGTPETVEDYTVFSFWYYGSSSVKFDENGKVTAWENNGGNLKLSK